MAQEILIIGQSGTGKTTSLENLKPEETFIINVTGKALPFKGFKTKYPEWNKDTQTGNRITLSNSNQVAQFLKLLNTKTNIKNVIVDDAGYLMAFEYINRAKETGFQKFTDLGTAFSNVILNGKQMRDDVNFIVIMHSEVDNDGLGNRVTKSKSVGKLVDQYLNTEGLFSIVLYTKVNKLPDNKGLEYVFLTQNDGSNTGKSPKGMFDQLEIPNDMNFVIKKIEEYNK